MSRFIDTPLASRSPATAALSPGRPARPADTSGVRIIFAGLPPGDYAVAAFHDADGNGELGTNILGIPTEGYGFSNGAPGFIEGLGESA